MANAFSRDFFAYKHRAAWLLAGLCSLPCLVASCSSNAGKRADTVHAEEPLVMPGEKAYLAARQATGAGKLTEKALLLGFRAGMNRTESILNLKKQDEAGRIHMGSVSGLHGALYTLTTAAGTPMEGFMGFDYVNNQLAKVSVTLFSSSCNAGVVEQLVATLAKKYGKPTHVYTSSKKYEKHSVWLTGGREIDVFCSSSSPVIEYSAVKLIDELPKTEAQEKRKEAQKSLQDL
jgi:hypothetical protein